MDTDAQDVLRLAKQLHDHIAELTKDLDQNDPAVVAALEHASNTVRNVEAAIECEEEDKVLHAYAERHRPAPDERAYSWEKLPMYEWNNELSRVLGRLFASIHKRYYIHLHMLTADTMMMSNCIALGHADMPEGEETPREQLRAYRFIGYEAACRTLGNFEELSRVTGYGASDVAHGKTLVRRIRDAFHASLNELDGVAPAASLLN